MLHATQPLFPPAADATGVPMYGAPPPPTAMGAPVPPAAYGTGAPVPPAPAPAPVPAAPVSSAAADLDEIFGFTPSNPPAPAAVTAPAPPAAAPAATAAPVYGAPYAAPPTAAPLPGVAPPAAPAAAFPATAGALPPATTFPAYAPPPTSAPYAPPPTATPGVPAATPGVPGVPTPGALPSALPAYPGAPAPAPGTAAAPGAPAPGAYPAAPSVEPLAAPTPGMPAPGGLPGAGALPSALPGVAAPVPGALPGALPAAPLGGVPAAPLGGAYGGVGGLPAAPGGLGAARPAGYTDPLALGLQDMTLDNSLSESERRQKESQRKIQELKDSIASFKKQNEAAAAEREAKTSGLQRDFGASAAAPSHVQPQQPPQQQQYNQPPQMERYTGSSADLKADLSRQFAGADDSVIADLVENVVQGHMSRAQAMEMLGEMCGTACNQATELSRKDEEYARMLQAQEEREVTMQRPASKTLGYEGLGNVSRLEQEQRDMDLAKQMQEKENLVARGGGEHDERPRGGSQFRGQQGGGGGGGGPPLPTHVSIPTFESRDGATFFVIEVILDNDDHYKVSKRYSQFDQLRQRVEASPFGKGGPAFPPKALTSSVATNEQRRHTLASWLQDMVERSQRAHVGDLREAISGFLEISSRRGAAAPSSRGW